MISNARDHTPGWVASSPMDEIRKRLETRLTELGRSQSWLSTQLGKSRAYVFQYLHHGSPRSLSYEDRLKIAELLDMEPRDLGISPIAAAQPGRGMAEDAEPYVPEAGSFLTKGAHFAYFRMKSNALDEHPKNIQPGKLLIFNINRSDVARIASGAIVVAQCLDKKDLAVSHGTIIRQFLAPNKLVTNSSGDNQILRIDDPSLSYEIVIKGVMISAADDFN